MLHRIVFSVIFCASIIAYSSDEANARIWYLGIEKSLAQNMIVKVESQESIKQKIIRNQRANERANKALNRLLLKQQKADQKRMERERLNAQKRQQRIEANQRTTEAKRSSKEYKQSPISKVAQRAGVSKKLPSIAAGLATKDNLKKLKKQYLFQEQKGRQGQSIAGHGSKNPIKDINRIVKTYGGNPKDWAKIVSISRDQLGSNYKAQARWYQNMKTGQRVEFKNKVEYDKD